MTLRVLLGGLLLLTPITSGADEPKVQSPEDDAKVLAGKWESKPKGAGTVVLRFEAGKAKATFFMTAKLYDIRGKEPKLVDSDQAEIKLQDDMGKWIFIREITKVIYVIKYKKLVLDGEYEANGTLYFLTGEWKKVEEKK